jgi:hypothetical protein
MATKNVFSKIGADDSDEEFEPKPMTKTTKKKEERKIAEKVADPEKKPLKMNEQKMQDEGFNMTG